MIYAVRYEPEAWEDLINLPIQVQSRIIKKIDWLAENFDSIDPLGLTGNLAGFYKLRVGDYRSIYELNNTEMQIIIVRIGHRSEIYDKLRQSQLRVIRAADPIGILGIIVHAISAEAKDFYVALGFERRQIEPMTLMITLNDLRACQFEEMQSQLFTQQI